MNPREFQELLSASIICPEKDFSIEFGGAGTLSDQEAIEVYADGYRSRLFEALGEHYESLALVLGNEKFLKLCLSYIDRHRSHTANLSDYGESFAEHILSREKCEALAELAGFEWSFKECFHRPYQKSVQLWSQENGTPQNITLHLLKSLQILKMNFPVHSLKLEKGDPKAAWRDLFQKPLQEIPQKYICLMRSPLGVRVVEVSPKLGEFLLGLFELGHAGLEFNADLLFEFCGYDPLAIQTMFEECGKLDLFSHIDLQY